MCAIFSASNINKFEILYQVNKERGNFASSVVCLKDTSDQLVLKKAGAFDFDKISLEDTSDYYVGHVQAPTSINKKWKYDVAHPFESTSWSVVHNGVLTNSEALKAKHAKYNTSTVDTSVIPDLLQKFTEECVGECPGHEIIRRTLELLEGTFALCIIDTDSNDVYIARQGSILHYNDLGDCSTLPGEGYKELPEGDIMMLVDHKSWVKVNQFKTKSPFLFI
jgi:glucosamine 6-phosphate synthetase-like amidotransferase/phosphosugar isomerase protein